MLETGLKVYDALYFGPGMYKMKSTAGTGLGYLQGLTPM
jgi:hypothetical protein